MLKRILISVLAVGILSAAAVVLAQQTRPTTSPGKPAAGSAGDRRNPPAPAVSKEDEEKLLATLKEKRPEQYERLMQLKKTDERRYRWAIRSLSRWYRALDDMPEEVRNAEIARYDTRLKIWKLSRQIRETTDAEDKAKLTGEMREAAASLFDAEQVVREYHLQQLEQRVKELKAELTSRKEQRDDIIDQWVKHFVEGPGRRMPHGDHQPGPEDEPAGGPENDGPPEPPPGGPEGE